MTTTRTPAAFRRLRDFVAAENLGQLSDRELLDRFAGRHDEAAFAALVKRHGPLVLSVCRRALGNLHDAEDAFQATFLVLARKAGSVGRRGSLGGWLHQVACRTAAKALTRARARKQREGRADARTPADPLQELTGRELLTVLDEELQRLPDVSRAPLVLCYLEGRTCDEGARQLGWAVRTFKRRLEQGRTRLHGRLARRGLALAAALLAAGASRSAEAASAALFAATAQAVLEAATGGAKGTGVSASAATLANGVMRATTLAKVQVAAVVLLAVGALTWATLAAVQPGQRQLAAGQEQPPAKEQAPAVVPEGELMTVTGRVLDPDGKPVADAQVGLMTHRMRNGQGGGQTEERLGLAKTDAEGRFRLQVRRISSTQDHDVRVLAARAGYGLGWAALHADAEKPEATVRLHPEQALRGRVVGLQGQPAGGLKLYLAFVSRKDGREEGDQVWFEEAHERFAPWPEPVTADEQGRFVLHGVGRGLVVGFHVRDDRFARQELHSIEVGDKEVARTLEPPQLVEGRVVCEDTGKPLPNARLVVRGYTRKPNQPSHEHGQITTQADAEGRFRVNSFPGNVIALWAFPAAGTPYLGVQKEIEWPKGSVRQSIDLRLPRGVLVRGKVVEETSGKPVAGAAVEFWPEFVDNPHYRAGVATGLWSTVTAQDDGSFRIAVLPGPCHLAVRGGTPDYIQREVFYDHGSGRMVEDPTKAGGQQTWSRWSVAGLAALDLKPGADPADVKITVRRGGTVKLRLVGPDGKPVARARVLARLPAALLGYAGLQPGEARDGAFELRGCDPGKVYPVYVLAPKEQLGAVVEVPGKGADEPVTIKLAPCGSAGVRFVDGQGRPKPGYKPNPFGLQLVVRPNLPTTIRPPGLRVSDDEMIWLSGMDPLHYSDRPAADAQGRLALPALIPGATYRIQERGGQREFAAEAGKAVELPDMPVP